jgi:micrococcal nuclease
MSQKEKLRMIGVDTPETVHPKKEVQHYGKEASDYMKKALTDKKVWLQMDAGPRDRYQRLLAYVWTEKPNDADNEQEIRTKMFNARLLLEGYGQVMTIQPNSKYADMFTKFQGEARDGNRGLWEVQ